MTGSRPRRWQKPDRREKTVDEISARHIASLWHGGQFSPLYAFASSGSITDGLESEIEADLRNSNASSSDRAQLRELRDYLRPRMWERAAYQGGRETGAEAAGDAAGAFAGEVAERVLARFDAQGPQAQEVLQAKPVWADGQTPRAVFETITGLDAHAEATWNLAAYDATCELLRKAWERGVEETFVDELVRELRAVA
jgi:hypothetical protein